MKTSQVSSGYDADFSAWNPTLYATPVSAQGQDEAFYITGGDARGPACRRSSGCR